MNIVCELSEYNFLNKLSKEYFCVFPFITFWDRKKMPYR